MYKNIKDTIKKFKEGKVSISHLSKKDNERLRKEDGSANRFMSLDGAGPFSIVDIIRDVDGDTAYKLTYFEGETKLYKHLVVKVSIFEAMFKRVP